MANVLNGLFGGGSKDAAAPKNVKAGDSDFADFAEAAEPSPAPITPVSNTFGGSGPAETLRPYTKWYNVHERHSISEFKAEGLILSAIAVILIFHLFGARLNRTKAKKWIQAHSKTLSTEFALVGFDNLPSNALDKKGKELVQTLADFNTQRGDSVMRENSLFEFATYATGRSNIAFVDVKLTLIKRFNPLTTIFEKGFAFFVESFPDPEDYCEATAYTFDGKEAQIVPGLPGAAEVRGEKSHYDGFVWAIVHKEQMKKLREDRYDVSLTFTKDNSKLPNWLTVMSESAEITEVLLTPELIKAAETAGDLLEYLIISDQPIEQPKTIDDTQPRKRIFLRYRLPSNNDYTPLLPIFRQFIRISDKLAKSAHFRPEVLKKVKSVREAAVKRIQKAEEELKAEERAIEREKERKAKRDAELNALDAKGQKKYLEREREKLLKKGVKKQTARA
ncbi:DUF1682 domain-protein [Podospora fimiseda]|uniref:DUF1682 domain-protein n=1 Tax=Podospora fimiseda TaxID=252190 RepID=A0AAN7BXP4_9PEZI|nr:DUF1682 domain-protein [Podospora fimiseda]